MSVETVDLFIKIRIRRAALFIVLDDIVEGGEAAIVHVRRGFRDVDDGVSVVTLDVAERGQSEGRAGSDPYPTMWPGRLLNLRDTEWAAPDVTEHLLTGATLPRWGPARDP